MQLTANKKFKINIIYFNYVKRIFVQFYGSQFSKKEVFNPQKQNRSN